jgi:ParB/RepB/Spo0J family partition protein
MDIARDIPLELVQPAPVLLREIDTLSIVYLNMVADFHQDGHLLNAILVRPIGGIFEVVDGMWRWTAAREVGLEAIQCIVREMSDEEVLVKQIAANATHKPTELLEFARHLERVRRLMGNDCTLIHLADRVGKSREWVADMLKLNQLVDPAKDAVRRGEITIGNARLLAKLKRHLQPAFIRDARLMSNCDFQGTVARVVNEYREAIKAGRMEAYYGGEAKPFCRGTPEILKELKKWPNAGPMLIKHNCKTPLDGWKLAVKWLMRMDPESLEARYKTVQDNELRRLEQQAKRREDREKG